MPRKVKERSPANRLVVALRKALGITQVELARDYLKCAWGTVARYETTHPPKGDALLKFFNVVDLSAAEVEKEFRAAKEMRVKEELLKKCDHLHQLGDRFLALYFEEQLDTLPKTLFFMSPTRWQEPCAYLIAKLKGGDAYLAALAFLNLKAWAEGTDERKSAAAQAAIRALKQESVRLGESPDLDIPKWQTFIPDDAEVKG
jgi:hypothetical protein